MSEPIANCFVTDTDIEPFERETNISFNSDSHSMRIYAAQRTVMESLWSHTCIDVDRLSVLENGTHSTIQPSEHDGEDIVGLWGEAPIGLLKIKKEPRSKSTPSQVVSDQEEVDQSVFGEAEA